MFKELTHIGFITKNIAESKRCYTAFGGVILGEGEDRFGNQYVYIQIAQSVVELIYTVTDETHPAGWAHLAFMIDPELDFDDSCKELVKKGLRPINGNASDGRNIAFFLNAANVKFEIIQQEDIPRIPNHSDPRVRALNYISIASTAEISAKCETFYTSDIGFQKMYVRSTPYGKKTLYAYGSDAVETVETSDPGALRKPLNHISIAVPDCDEAWRRLKDNGITCGKIKPYPEGYQFFDAFGADGEIIVVTDRLARIQP